MIRPVVLALALSAAPVLAAAETHSWDQAAEAFTQRMAAEGRIVVRQGERVIVRLDAENKGRVEAVEPAASVIGEEPKAPEGTLAFTLGMDAKAGWVLKAQNGAMAAMAYGALIAVPFGDHLGLAPTSTCAVPSGVVGLESWRNEVVMIALGPFSPRPEGASRCETLAKPPAGALPVAKASGTEAAG